MQKAPLIVMDHVNKRYGAQQVVRDVQFTLGSGERCVILGASGSGKSTLLYLLAGLESPDSGSIFFDSVNMSQLSLNELAIFRNNYIGLIFQFHFLLPSMNAIDNILLPSRISTQKVDMKAVTKKIMDLSHELGVNHLLKKYPYELSGGEQQRINILRALSRDPKIILCDEPTGNLDSQNSQKVVQLLMSLSQTKNTALIFVTHDKTLAGNFSIGYEMRDGFLTMCSKGS